ncbi:CBP80/20-dependent translation initiation factor [Onthophagus taurus]|uniref:CBP80/20-dependent translation initiation factor n=1 Tax=Onthophagus taurus TaxID=166361 RepID=UPI000C205D5A|nr:CBP80/20-dependent translation initiation factor [Onthophagus taurus]
MSQNQQSGGLKRSQKADFQSSSTTVLRERSFVKQNSRESSKRRSQTMMAANLVKGNKPTMEIYRPPNVRIDNIPQQHGNNKLNVHAKEFTMGSELQTSKSSGNLALFNFDCNNIQHHQHQHPLQQSKSSGNVLRHLPHSIIPIVPLPILHSTSTSQILNHLPRVNFQMTAEALSAHHQFLQQAQQQQQQQKNQNWNQNSSPQNHNLRRSKSTGAAEIRNMAKNKEFLMLQEADLGAFSEHSATVKIATENPNQLQSRTLMELAKIIMERVVEGIKYSEAGAKLCVTIIEKERTQTFIESLINTCQQWYQERDKILRGIKAGDGTRFSAFMWFLTEMCGQLKRHQLRDRFENLQPDLVLLSVLAKCCQACVSLPIKCLAETECLFFVLTSIGRDLENELPAQLEQLLANVRDGFLASVGSPSVRKTLLQLIELHASNWQLPGSSVLYYYPRIK